MLKIYFRFDEHSHDVVIFLTYFFLLVTCIPREQSSESSSYCGIYTGTVSIFGHEIGSSTAKSILNVVLNELPDALSSITDYGVTHLEGSGVYSHVISLPGNSGRGDFMTAGTAVGVVFAVIVLLLGIVSLIRYMRMDYRFQSDGSISKMEAKERNRERWGLLRFVNVNAEDCDRTQISSLCSSRNGSRRTSPKQYRSPRSVPASKPIQQVKIHHHYDSDTPYIVDDSPYIVEPDDDDDERNKDCFYHSGAEEEENSMVDPLSTFGLDVF